MCVYVLAAGGGYAFSMCMMISIYSNDIVVGAPHTTALYQPHRSILNYYYTSVHLCASSVSVTAPSSIFNTVCRRMHAHTRRFALSPIYTVEFSQLYTPHAVRCLCASVNVLCFCGELIEKVTYTHTRTRNSVQRKPLSCERVCNSHIIGYYLLATQPTRTSHRLVYS